jgi:hypothetical protein
MEGRDQTIQYLTRKKKELTEKREKLMRPVQDVDKDLTAISTALAFVLRDETPELETGFPIRKLRNLTQTQALIEIARYNGGEIRSLDVKPILIAAKLMKNSKNAAHMVNGAITRSGLFERIGRGHYKFKGDRTIHDEVEEFVKRANTSLNGEPVQ